MEILTDWIRHCNWPPEGRYKELEIIKIDENHSIWMSNYEWWIVCGAPRGTELGMRILSLPAATHRVPVPGHRVPCFCNFLSNIGGSNLQLWLPDWPRSPGQSSGRKVGGQPGFQHCNYDASFDKETRVDTRHTFSIHWPDKGQTEIEWSKSE